MGDDMLCDGEISAREARETKYCDMVFHLMCARHIDIVIDFRARDARCVMFFGASFVTSVSMLLRVNYEATFL